MLFALLEICRGFFQLLLKTLGFVLGLLSLVEGALHYFLGLPEPFFEISFLSGGFPLGNGGGNWGKKDKIRKSNDLSLTSWYQNQNHYL